MKWQSWRADGCRLPRVRFKLRTSLWLPRIRPPHEDDSLQVLGSMIGFSAASRGLLMGRLGAPPGLQASIDHDPVAVHDEMG